MLRQQELVGVFGLERDEVKPFTDKQIALVQTFADQAVIAIENTRLLNELRQSLDQQTAMAEVLGVISSSPGDLQPVFDNMLRNAVRICDAKFGMLLRFNGEAFHMAAEVDLPPDYAEFEKRRGSFLPPAGTLLDRVMKTKRVSYTADMAADAAAASPARRGGARSAVTVPMLKDDKLIGAILIYRQEVQPFTDKQITLVQNFAAQAVIAIENTRLLNELRQSLEQQTATADVLGIISSSPGELEPVFQSILENATRICAAKFGSLWLYEGEKFRPVAVAASAAPEWGAYVRQRGAFTPQPNQPLGELLTTKKVVHAFSDIEGDASIAAFRLGGARAFIAVPLLKENTLVGAINIFRQEARAFADREVALVTNFAAQAVIAIENARLLNELRGSLQQQTATSEVLGVISSSPGELEPVFQAMLENATRICQAKFGFMFRYDGTMFHTMAQRHAEPALAEFYREREARAGGAGFLPGEGTPLRRLLNTKEVVCTVDESDRANPSISAKLGGARSHLAVPMLKEGQLVGAIVIYRTEVLPFTEKQTELVKNFAAQAVIAIENTRLLNELRQRTSDLTESLEQQTATSEVLRVISSSSGELKPVFQAMLENATRICEASFGSLFRFDGKAFYLVAEVGTPQELAEAQRQGLRTGPTPGGLFDRAMRTKQVIHTADARKAAAVGLAARFGGARTQVIVPMLKDDDLIGAILIYRQEVRPFTEKQVELVKSFAAQAVIAIENTRLLNELRESLQQQTATADVLKVISRSTFDLHVVLNTLTESAAQLCGANRGVVMQRDGDVYRLASNYGYSPEAERYALEHPLRPDRGSVTGRAVLEGRPIHISDVLADPEFKATGYQQAMGYRTLLAVPLLRDGTTIGTFSLTRNEVNPFTDKQIELVTTFADQAVIAIENARLLNELRESLQQQTATADVLKIISRSTFDLQVVLNTLVESAAKLCEAEMASINRQFGQVYRQIASYGFSPEFEKFMEEHPIQIGRGTTVARAIEEKRPIQIPDVFADPEHTNQEAAKIGGIRSVAAVPMFKDNELIGVIGVYRRDVRPFTEKQIELVQTFADQAVIAIENVRLFDEIQDKSRQLEVASQHKSQFLANMSHELRTPLNAILGYTELMADGAYGEPSEKMLGILKRLESNGKHLLGLINDVLDLSKIEAGQLELELSDYCVQDIAQTVRSTLEPLASDKKLAFKLDLAPDLPPGHGDGRRLTQVLINLVGNAIKFTDTGEVAIKAEANNGSFHVSVRDTGPGISAADQAKLFQEFQQADNAITRKKGGTGLGLAISKRIIEMHGGRVWVESQVGQGSTFAFTLPIVVERQVEPA
jgi:GAF domain-containing protein